jgi:hypothetical protein
MRSRTVRITSATLAWIGLIAASVFIFQSERTLSDRRTTLRAFDVKAREASTALADARAGQQAYVAAGQGVDFWMPKVAAHLEGAEASIDQLRTLAATADAREALMNAASHLTELGNMDRRARDYLRSGQPLMAGDVVFAGGGETAAEASHLVETARVVEQQAFDVAEGASRRLAMAVGGGAAGLAGLLLLVVAVSPARSRPEGQADTKASLGLLDRSSAGSAATLVEAPRASLPGLKAAAALCTEMGRIRDVQDLSTALGHAADAMDASGLVVWVGDARGADLRPIAAHGYPEDTLARMPSVPRSANNAAAAAYRAGTLQIVLARPGSSSGAVVAPLLSSDGCIGALTAEIRSGGETSDSAQALAAIFAAQLVGVLAPPAAEPHADVAATA